MKCSLSVILFTICFNIACFAQIKPPALKIEHLAGNAYVYTTYNLFGTQFFPSNSMYVVTQQGVVMIDTPWDTTQFQPLLDSIEARHHAKVVLSISTHSHDDRTAGVDFLKSKGVRTYCSKMTFDLCRQKHEKQPQFYFTKDTTFVLGEYTFETFYPGEAHTKDNIVVWIAKDKILYGGCLAKSTQATDLGNISEANLKDWPLTIKKVQRKFPDPSYIITGHQSWNDINSLNHTLQLLKNKK